jgi:ADP-ribose pyrophosphatase YjhB (NUDIX family)
MIRLLYLGFRVYCFIFRPKTLGVRIMLIQNGQVLLVRHTYLPGWYMPGGAVNRGETVEQAARREVREEVGGEMGELYLLGAYTHFGEHKSDHNTLFLCTDFTFNGEKDKEIAELRFFPLEDLPDELLPRHRRRLEEYRAGVDIPQFGEW